MEKSIYLPHCTIHIVSSITPTTINWHIESNFLSVCNYQDFILIVKNEMPRTILKNFKF